MKNDLFSIGPFTVHGYGLMIAIGVLSAYYMVEYRAKKKQMDWEKVFPLTVWSVLGGTGSASSSSMEYSTVVHYFESLQVTQFLAAALRTALSYTAALSGVS